MQPKSACENKEAQGAVLGFRHVCTQAFVNNGISTLSLVSGPLSHCVASFSRRLPPPGGKASCCYPTACFREKSHKPLPEQASHSSKGPFGSHEHLWTSNQIGFGSHAQPCGRAWASSDWQPPWALGGGGPIPIKQRSVQLPEGRRLAGQADAITVN